LIPTFTAIEAFLLRLISLKIFSRVRPERGTNRYNPHVAMLTPQSTIFDFAPKFIAPPDAGQNLPLQPKR
jgi:hypothetical protein